ncbi:hypothetical protein TWF694_006645 [Orbilia ellipsospora]|uniref:Uncharacterized protein n=1 Tax=Orbilia ellipsospora TaxID=2528407 RepID=A0AAV9XL65_9PEZI
MNNENRPPTISIVPQTPPPSTGTPLEVIKETFSPVHSSIVGEGSQAKIRTQVLRGSDHITGLARHEFKHDGQFGDPPPNPVGVSLTSLETSPANIHPTELDTNICKGEWLKSTIDWPFPHLFDDFRQGFADAKHNNPNQSTMKKIKGTNYDEDFNIPEEKWGARAYVEGVKFGKRYIADRLQPGEAVIMEEFDYANAPPGQVEHPRGGFEAFFKRMDNEEAERKRARKKHEVTRMWKDMAQCKCCEIS